MKRGIGLQFAVLLTLLITGCSSLPGLRVLTGEDTGESVADRTVQSLDLVMADKTGATDPSLIAAADRIEAADSNVDIVEIRQDFTERMFNVNLLFRPPQIENTLAGQVQLYDAIRRAVELSWQGTMRESEGTDLLHVTLLGAGQVTTLDNGPSFVGYVIIDTEIDRAAAASYLSGERSLTNFMDMIAQGTLSFMNPTETIYYQGQPNHPLFMLASSPQ